MSDVNKQSRSNKFEKRRKNTKKISILMIIASILILFLLILWFFGGEDKDTTTPDNNSNEHENLEIEEDLNDDNQDEINTENNGETEDQSSENAENDVNVEDTEINENENAAEEDIEVETEQVDSSDDNVIEAYTGSWQPIGTVQEGPHTTVYDTGSQDRIEIKQAVMSATGLGEDLTEHWVGNGGDQKVVATVSGHSEIYRVYLSWVDQQGWQVTQVERLKEVDS